MQYKGHILVVDDEKSILSSLKGILSDEGYMISLAEDGNEAISVIENNSPNLVLLDIWIPGMDGLKTLYTIKNSQPDIEIIMMSGHGTIDTAVRATKLGAFDFIEKPFSMENLLLTVKKAFQQQRNRRQSMLDELKRHKLIGKSIKIKETIDAINKAVSNKYNVLITGEDGTGKELIAKLIHEKYFKGYGHFIKINCKNLTSGVLKNYIFSKKRTAGQKKPPYKNFYKNTIFFHNIGSTPVLVQPKIISFLESIKKEQGRSEIRIIASLVKPSPNEKRKNRLQKRLSSLVAEYIIPTFPLRERRDDIPIIADHYIKIFSSDDERNSSPNISPQAMECLIKYDWPGNVYELKNVIEDTLSNSAGKMEIGPDDILPLILKNKDTEDIPFEFSSVKEAEQAWEKEYILNTLKNCGWDRQETAKLLRIDCNALKGKIDFHNISVKKQKRKDKVMQRTTKRSVVLCGHGLHSGIKTGLILSPLPANSGIIFQDIATGEQVPAHINNVQSTTFATFLRKNFITIKTVEHIMAVLHMYRLNNLLIKAGDEIPIMDGSAIDFCRLIEDGGIIEQDDYSEEIVIKKPISISSIDNDKNKFISIEPYNGFCVEYTLSYPPPINRQRYKFIFENEKLFKKDIAPARTFAFLKDVEKLEEMGLAGGGKLSNIILMDDEKVINTTLRFTDEFVRHKILDIIGDFYLMGRPIRGKITASMTGHGHNILLVKEIKKEIYGE